MSLGKLNSNSSYAIYGDAATQNATIVPNLASIADGDAFQVVSSLDHLQTWQKYILENNVYQSTTREEYPQQTSGSTLFTQVFTWEFRTFGFVDLNKMIIEIPTNFTVAPTLHTLPELEKHKSVEYAFMDLIQDIQIFIGENSFRLNNSAMTSIQGLKFNMVQTKKTRSRDRLLAKNGFPTPSNFCGSYATNLAVPANAFGAGVPTAIVNLALPLPLTQIAPIMLDTTDNLKSIVANIFGPIFSSVSVNSTCNSLVTFALADIISFFNMDNSYLPKETKIKIILSTRTPAPYFVDANGLVTVGASAFIPNLPPKIVYNAIQLQEGITKEFNSRWIARPLCYNYLKWDRVQIPFDGVTTKFTQNILYNQQRPLQLVLVPQLQDVNAFDNGTYFLPNDIANVASSALIVGTGIAPGFLFTYIRVYANGILIYDHKNELASVTLSRVANGYNTGKSYIDSIQREENENKDIYQRNENATLDMTFEPRPYVINLAIGEFFKRGLYPTDQGPITLRLEYQVNFTLNTAANMGISYTQAVPSSFVLQCYYKYPAQVLIDSSQNVTEVQWPAVAINDKPYISQTINTN